MPLGDDSVAWLALASLVMRASAACVNQRGGANSQAMASQLR